MTCSARGAEGEGAKEGHEMMVSPLVIREENSNVTFGTLLKAFLEKIKKLRSHISQLSTALSL